MSVRCPVCSRKIRHKIVKIKPRFRGKELTQKTGLADNSNLRGPEGSKNIKETWILVFSHTKKNMKLPNKTKKMKLLTHDTLMLEVNSLLINGVYIKLGVYNFDRFFKGFCSQKSNPLKKYYWDIRISQICI